MSKNKNFFAKKREWSIIKDTLLDCYLRPYFQKLLYTNKPICYIDCFAGKGKFDDGNDGSPIIALKQRDEALLATYNYDHAQIDMIFIESEYADDLEQNIKKYSKDGSTKVVSERYEEEITQLLKNKKRQNIFLYIDPYGIKSLDFDIFRRLESYQFHTAEILLNFNSFGFFRVACSVMGYDASSDEAFQDIDELVERESLDDSPSQGEELLNRVAGGDYWKKIVEDYKTGKINGFQAEKRLSTEYKDQLKKHFHFVLDMPIRLKTSYLPKYRMIHACNHIDGCFLMAENMIRRKDELYINVQQERQPNLFDDVYVDEGICYTKDDIKKMIDTLIGEIESEVHLKEFMVSFVNKYGLICEFKLIHEILEELEVAGKISITRFPEQTERGRKSSFWNEREGNQVILRRNKI